ncbi:MAG: PepSY-associated TM helix domain-containing protein [Acidobacteriota bacterium]
MSPNKPEKRHGPFKLNRRGVRLFYDIHSWLGILGGMVLFICCFSGTLALFEHELFDWEKPQIRFAATGEMLGFDQLFERAQERLGTDKDMFVMLPNEHMRGLQARVFEDGHVEKIFLDPYTGVVVEGSGGTAFEFLTHLHTDLHLPRPFGRYLVGFLGIFMLMSLISGVMAHPKALQQLFLLRWRPRMRLTLSDLHKQLGIWGLAFGLVMAFTGAVIGLLGLFAPVMVLSAFGGDVGKATEAFSGPNSKPTGTAAEMLSIGSLIDRAEQQHPDFVVQSVFVRHWGDESAEVALNLDREPYRQLTAGETHRVSLVDGTTLHVSAFTERGVGTRLFGAVQPLHYGLFGGLGLKLLYFALGIALSLGIVTGSMIWLERRKPSRTVEPQLKGQYFWLGRLHLGVCLGLVVASALALAAGRFQPSKVEPVFWLSWLALLIIAYGVRNAFAYARVGGFATAAILGAIALGDLMGSTRTETTVQVNLVLMALGLLMASAAALSPKQAPGAKISRPPIVAGDMAESQG